jgi:hypothetical protein
LWYFKIFRTQEPKVTFQTSNNCPTLVGYCKVDVGGCVASIHLGNSVAVHPQLSHNRFPVDGALVGPAIWLSHGEGRAGCWGAKSSQIAHHFYPICFGKCYSPFTYIHGPKEELYTSK